MSGWKNQRFVKAWRHKHIKTWYIFVAFILLTLSSIYLLRRNNLEMVELRNAVVQADKSGEGVTEAIETLNEHIFDHMNTTTIRPIELVNTYNRRAQKIIKEASKSSTRDIYKEAARACEQQGIPLTSIAACAAEYAVKNNPGVGPKKIVLPDKNLFIYSFVSPRWTPDLAGISLVLSVVTGLWLIARLIEFIAVRLVIRRRLKNNLQ